MRLDPPMVLVAPDAVQAIGSGDPDVTAAYLDLVAAYERGEVLLGVLADDVHHSPLGARHGPFAPADTLHIGRQHRRAADRTDAPTELRLPLVMCERHRIGRVLTTDGRYADYGLAPEALPVHE